LGIKLTPKQRAAMRKQLAGLHGESTSSAPEAPVEAVPEAPKTFEVKLVGYDEKSKIKVIKEVRAISGLGLKEAKEMVEGVPKSIAKDLKPEQAEELKKKLVEAGGIVELV
jgi:large subunit ribosomal protein L7/L12